jgi:ribonuclease P protein subunit POP4
MSITKNNIHKHELIGLSAKVISSSDLSLKDVSGIIVDETKKTIRFEVDGEEKVLPKKGTVLLLNIKNQKIKLNVSQLTFRPEDRIKKAKRKMVT